MPNEYEELLPTMDYTNQDVIPVFPDNIRFEQGNCSGELVNDKLTGDIIARGSVKNTCVDSLILGCSTTNIWY